MRIDYQGLSPAGIRALGGVYMYLAGCGLPKRLLDLVYLRASQIDGCAYCIDSHGRDLLAAGIAAGTLMLVTSWRDAGEMFSDKERAALEWTEAVTLIAQSHAPDDAFARVQTHFSEKEVSDLTIAIALINSYNRIAISFRRGPETV
jgi:AhpD family alkylhydroperoxidase